MAEYMLFGKSVTIPPSIKLYLEAQRQTGAIVAHAIESVDLLFEGILANKYDLGWAMGSNPEEEEGSVHYSLFGLCERAGAKSNSGNVLNDLNICLNRLGYPRYCYGPQLQQRLQDMARVVKGVYDEACDAYDKILESRMDAAERARNKTSDSLLGAAFNLASVARASNRASKRIGSDNLNFMERSLFDTVQYDELVSLRPQFTDFFLKVGQELRTKLASMRIPDWGVPVEMEAIKDKVAETENLSEDAALVGILACPFDSEFAVRCVDRFGEVVQDLRLVIRDMGGDWDAACGKFFASVRSKINFKSEESLLKYKKKVEEQVVYFSGVKSSRDLLDDIKKRLKEIDRQMRTVGDVVCSTREAAVASRAEQSAIEAAVACYEDYPVDLTALLRDLSQPMFKTEYGCAMAKRVAKKIKASIQGYVDARLVDCDEETAKSLRLEVLTMADALGNLESFSEVVESVDAGLARLDTLARTVGDVVCPTREEATLSKAEKPAVDTIVSGVKLFPLSAVEALIEQVSSAGFKTYYGKATLEKLRKQRQYMLTVDGVAYETSKEAEEAFAKRCEQGNVSLMEKCLMLNLTAGGRRQFLAAKYWPGSLDPDSITTKVVSGKVGEMAGMLGKNIKGVMASAGESKIVSEGLSRLRGLSKMFRRKGNGE